MNTRQLLGSALSALLVALLVMVAPGSAASPAAQRSDVSRALPALVGPEATLLLHFDAANIDGGGAAGCAQTLTTWTDLSGNGHNASLNSFSFNCPGGGTDGWAGNGSVADPYRLSFNGGWTQGPAAMPAARAYAVWFRSRTNGNVSTLFATNNASTTYARYAGGGLQVTYNGSAGQQVGIAIGVWHQLVITNDGATTTYFLDGVAFGTESRAAESGTSSLNIGSRGSGSDRYNGDIASFRVYSDALTESDILTLYLAERGRFEADPAPQPKVDRLLPAVGGLAGGETIAIYGWGLSGTTAVAVDGVGVPFTVVHDGKVTFVAPAHAAGQVDVSLTTAGGTITSTDAYRYTGTPTDNVIVWLDAVNVDANGTVGGNGETAREWVSLVNGNQAARIVGVAGDTQWLGSGLPGDSYGLRFSAINYAGEVQSGDVEAPRTIAVWFVPTTVSNVQTIYATDNASGYARFSGTTQLDVRYSGGNVYTPVVAGVSYLLVLTNDGTMTHFYLTSSDGTYYVTQFATETRPPETGVPYLNIGQRLSGVDHFHGCIGEFRVYGDYLTPSEVASLTTDFRPVCGSLVDTDRDGVADVDDYDDDNDGIPDVDEPTGDTDGDGIPDRIDLDSDDDGIPDVTEAGGTDSDGDGVIDGFVDVDGDGLHDPVDNVDSGSGANEVTNGVPLDDPDTDGDGRPNRIDIDADDDGIPDNIESQSTVGYVPPAGTDIDGDGLDDAYDPTDGHGPGPAGPGSALPIQNTDASDQPDYLDLDSDNDGLSDTEETNRGTPNGNDADLDGLDDGYDDNIGGWAPNDGITNPANDPQFPDGDGDVAGDVPGSEDVDYRDGTPLAALLASFDARAQVDHVLVTWETVSEIDNAGFNLYRGLSADGEGILLGFTPSAAPGSTAGAAYRVEDIAVQDGQTYWYWLEAIDLSGAASRFDPVSATYQVPTAVVLSELQASSVSIPAVTPGWVGLAGALGMAMIAGLTKRRRT